MNSEALQQACPVPFDEGRLWKGADSAELKAQLQRHFQNITKVMDCVGCEKCKLWGKLQMLGARPTAAHPLDIWGRAHFVEAGPASLWSAQ